MTYAELVEKARETYESEDTPHVVKAWLLENIIYPAGESEDERIRKELIEHIKANKEADYVLFKKFSPDDVIAWLEKQDFHYSFEIKAGHWYKCVCDYMLNGSHLMFKNDRLYYCRRDWRLEGEIDERNVKNIGVNGYKSFFRPATNQEIKDWLEKQGEKPTDKVEPKFEPQFKVGDGITDGYIYYKITEILDDRYIIESKYDKRGAILFEYENRYHLWTINDAKDGDVLVAKDGHPFIFTGEFDAQDDNPTAYCGINSIDKFIIGKGSHWTFKDGIKPATKEQRELLFEKMNEAEYKWDAEKKKLKKMEVVSKESEDERIREQLCDFLRDNMLYQDAQYFISWLEGKKKSADEVMKIRRKAYSDGYKHGQDNIAISLGKESIEALEHFVRSIGESGHASPYDNQTKLVYRLLEQLKKIVNFIHC